MHIECDEALTGSNVRITQSGPLLQLCEVDILEDDLNDFARNYVTVDSSGSSNKEYALDGFDIFRHRKTEDATCTYIMTNHYKAWWEVTLDQVYSIGQLVIYTTDTYDDPYYLGNGRVMF